MHTIMDLCFLCTKDYHCVPVDSRIVSQVEYILPEITIFKLGIPLRICSVCDGALYAFSKFKQFYVESTLRLEACIKGAQGPPLHTDTPFPGPAIQLQRNTTMSQNQLQTSGVHTDTNSNNAENISIEKNKLRQTTQDQDFCKSVPENTLETHFSQPDYNIDGASATLYTSDTYGVKPEMIEEIFIKEELKDPQEIETYDATNNQTEDSTEEVNVTPEISAEMWEGTSGNPKQDFFTQHNQVDTKKHNRNTKHHDFTHKYDLTAKIHNGIKKFQCSICKKRFSEKGNLKQHLKIHSGVKDFYCDTCNESFTQETHLKIHNKIHEIQGNETPKESWMCSVCNKIFPYKNVLDLHMTSHIGIKDFQCNFCRRSFSKKATLESHLKYHSGVRNFRCNLCSKSFTQNCYLAAHMKAHSVIKDFQCDVCSKSFNEKYLLSKHVKIHSERNYHCNVCTKSFTYKFDLTRHMKTHAGIKDFQCEICSKSFTKKLYLLAHMRNHPDIK